MTPRVALTADEDDVEMLYWFGRMKLADNDQEEAATYFRRVVRSAFFT